MTAQSCAIQRLRRIRRRAWTLIALSLIWQVAAAEPDTPLVSGTDAQAQYPQMEYAQ